MSKTDLTNFIGSSKNYNDYINKKYHLQDNNYIDELYNVPDIQNEKQKGSGVYSSMECNNDDNLLFI